VVVAKLVPVLGVLAVADGPTVVFDRKFSDDWAVGSVAPLHDFVDAIATASAACGVRFHTTPASRTACARRAAITPWKPPLLALGRTVAARRRA
jgi:hypothetical protein